MQFILNLILYFVGLIVYLGAFLFTAALLLSVAVATYIHCLLMPDRSQKDNHDKE
jgi:hypothetical protein